MRRPFGLGAFVLLVVSAVALSGCARPEKKLAVDFVASEHDQYLIDGTATVQGQGFLRQQGGGVVRCAGEQVWLFPGTSFFREFVSVYKSGYAPTSDLKLSDKYKALVRKSTCDADGHFRFDHLPSGNWFVATQVVWTVEYARQGGTLVGEVQTKPGAVADAILADASKV